MTRDYVTAGVLLGALVGYLAGQWYEAQRLARELKAIQDKRKQRRPLGWEGIEP